MIPLHLVAYGEVESEAPLLPLLVGALATDVLLLVVWRVVRILLPDAVTGWVGEP